VKFLVVGSGAREHALAWKLSQEAEVLVAPGNAGIATEFECLPISALNQESLLGAVQERSVDTVVVGPEDPLVAGLGDFLRSGGVPVVGPNRDGALLEASKAWSKELMVQAGVPTAEHQSFEDPEAARRYIRGRYQLGRQVAVKASGNALGKGVVVCESEDEAIAASDRMLQDREFGDAGATIVVEDRLVGREFSLLTLVSGRHYRSLPVAQDYKRIGDGDTGPNTGGMGSYSPVSWLAPELVDRAEREVVEPMLAALRSEGIDYRGVLFSGLLVQDGIPYCLEYNVRFGDPETQSVMMRLGGGFAEALAACARGQAIPEIEVLTNHVVSVVCAAGGYPGSPERDREIRIGNLPSGTRVFFAGVAAGGDGLVTAGGRVLTVASQALSLSEARERAYQAVGNVRFQNMQVRSDIASA
jgi:phosphoribosylamine--glycine ligase